MENETELNEVSPECNILYELLVYSEWKQEPELPKILLPQHEGLGSLLKNIVPFALERDRLSSGIGRLLNWQQPWRLGVGDGGKVVAIIQEVSLEIRSSRDEYSSVIGKAALPKDPFPQWRRWCWSPDCSILAIGFSNGSIRAYDLMGSNLFTILPSNFQQDQTCIDTNHALSACFFIQARVTTRKWSSELVTVDYRGELRSFLVSPTEGFQESHCFSFGSYYRLGITSISYHPAHSILFVAGPTGLRNDPNLQDHSSGIGVTAWRILNDHPFYKIVAHGKKHDSGFLPESIWNKLPSLRQKHQQSIVVRMEMSPSSKHLAALHSCGGISVWSVPSLKKIGFWLLSDQPGWDSLNPFSVEAPTASNKKSLTTFSVDSFFPIDLDWWSDEAVVISRNSGAVSVCGITNLQNLLGESPEFLAGAAQVKRFHNEQGFLALECEIDALSKNRKSDLDLEDDFKSDSSDDENECDENSTSFLNRFSVVLRSALYLVTDLERFRPRRRRLRLFRRTYRLLALRSTTPGELYSRKLDNEEYGEALTLAHTYNLDCDLVYQRQWRNNKVSVASIRDFLSKVSNQMWVLKECVERVPESLLATRELIEFGLKATGKEAFRSLGSKRKVKDLDDMTDEQKQFLKYRCTLLRHQDRLTTYEKILGGSPLADEMFEFAAYADFRSASSLRACVQFARAAHCSAVECMLVYHCSQSLQHWLPILSNIPETICPSEYSSLLPECASEGVVFPLKEAQLRAPDWSEKEPYCMIDGVELDTPEEVNECLYQFEPGLSAYRAPINKLTPNLVQQWYCERIRTIERSSRMVDNALTLLRLAQDRNVTDFGHLHHDLQTLEALVYELYLEDICLEDLEKKSSLEKCKLLMSKTSEDTFMSDLNNLLIPFLDRIDKDIPGKKQELFHNYIVGLASEDLVLPQKLFKENIGELSYEEKANLIQACLYAYHGTNQLLLAQQILSSFPKSRATSSTNDQLNILEMDLAGSLILHRNQTPKTLGYIRDNKHDIKTLTELLTRMSRTVVRSTRSLTEAVWSNLLNDILMLQQSVFTCVPLQTCYEIFCSTLLSSGDLTSIKSAGKYLCRDQKKEALSVPGSMPFLSMEKCQTLVLTAAREYIDSAGSLTDPGMELALACLHLAQDESDDVKEELNLVSSFQFLHEFGIKMLPLQVRLCPDRLRLIEECLKKKPGAHRNVNRLLQLAASLNIFGNDMRKRQGRVLMLVAESAFSVNDLRCCGEVCQRIVAAGYAPGWEVVSQLGRCSRFTDLSLRAQLLAFALQHCPSEMLQELTEAMCYLEIESLQHVVNKQVTMHNASLSAQLEDPMPQSVVESVGADFLQGLQIGELAVRETTRRLLTRVGDSKFWKKAFHLGWDEEKDSDGTETSVVLGRYSCHAFYLSLYDSFPSSPSQLGPSYDSFASPDTPPRIQLEQALLRISLLEQGLGIEEQTVSNVLMECARSLLPEDNCLGLAHLLAVHESLAKEASDHVFGSNLSEISLKMAQYHAALLHYRSLVLGDREKLHDIFLQDPNKVIDFVSEEADTDDLWAKGLNAWKARLTDFQQDQDLLNFGCGVDVERFSNDAQYRHDSILGLAMSEESEKLNFALALASRHNVDRSEVIAEHVVNLLISNLPSAEILERVTESPLLELIEEAAQEIKTKIESSVLPSVHGQHIELLELCFIILNQVAPSDRSGRLLPKDHLKLLAKVKATSAAIDYKLLLSGPKYTSKAIEPSLTAENVRLVAKLLKAMPSALIHPLSTSQLYGILIRKQLQGPAEFQTVEAIGPLLENMASQDVVELMENVCFPSNERGTLLKYQTVENLLKTAESCCKNFNDPERTHQLALWRQHVEKSHHLLRNWPDEQYCRSFYNSRGDFVALEKLFHNALLCEEKPLAFVLDLISAANTLTLESVITDLLRKSCSSASEENDNCWPTFNALLLRVEEIICIERPHQFDHEWESLLHPMATQDFLPPDLRLKVLNILKILRGEEVQESTLLLPHTRAVVASAWPKISIHADDVQEEEKRANLAFNLLDQTENWMQRNALLCLLDLWPPFSDNANSHFHSAFIQKLLLNCIRSENGEWNDQKASFISDVFKNRAVNFSWCEPIIEEVFQDTTDQSDDEGESDEKRIDVQLLMFLCLLCDDSRAQLKALTLAQHHLMEPLHDRVAELALSRKLVVDLISTPAYSDLLSLVLVSQPQEADSIIEKLIQKKYIPEAGALILRSINCVPRFMRTFSTSLVAGLGHTLHNSSSKEDFKSQSGAPESSNAQVRLENHPADIERKSKQPLLQEKNDWDVSDDEWNSVDESDVKSHVTDPSRLTVSHQKFEESRSDLSEAQPSSPDCCSDTARKHEVSETKISPTESVKQDDVEGWDDWYDDEIESLPLEKQTARRAFVPTAPTSSTPPSFLPSSRSAFVRVPQRELRDADTPGPSEMTGKQPTRDGWDGSSDEEWNW